MKLSLVGLFVALAHLGQAQSLDKAILAINNGEIQNAKNELLELSNKDPRDGEAKFWLGVSLYMSYSDNQINPDKNVKPLIDAGISFEKANFLNPSFNQGEQQKHIKAFQNLAFNAGVSKFQKTELEIAFTLFKMSSQCADWQEIVDVQSFYYTGHCANKIGEYKSALPYLERLVNNDPKNEKYSKELLKSYIGLNENGKATNLINKVLVSNQSSKYFWQEYMSLNMKTENLNEALKAAKQLCLLDQGSSKDKTILASLYDQTGDETSAIETYKEVIKTDSDNIQATFNLGVMLYNQVIALNKSAPSKTNKEKSKMLLDESESYLLVAQTLDPSNMDIPILLDNISSMK